jgi:spore coat protein CotH
MRIFLKATIILTILFLFVICSGCSKKSSSSSSTTSGISSDSDIDETDLNIPDGYYADLPERIQHSSDNRRLVVGAGSQADFYNFNKIRTIKLEFNDPNWWNQMVQNHESETELPAKMTYDGVELASNVGVRFKGQTSYWQNNTEKKSFNISTDYENENQEIGGFTNINLNCAFGDDTFMREVIYEHTNQIYMPSVSVNYVELYINESYWGIYINSQQIDNNFMKEWFLSKKGSRWRAEPPSGESQGFGSGFSAINYLGDSFSSYAKYYTLKKYYKDTEEEAWSDLINVAKVLEYTSSDEMEAKVSKVLDLDRTLWFLVMENVFDDEDGYIYKGENDYYLFWDPVAKWLTPIEYDGNSTMQPGYQNWSPFFNAANSKYPLLYRILNVPSIRQRYLAHMRTVLNETFNPTYMNNVINNYSAKIDSYIQVDSKKMMTYSEYTYTVFWLKTIIDSRYNNLISNSEVKVSGLEISNTQWAVNGTTWGTPSAINNVTINTTISGTMGINIIYACLGKGVAGPFSKRKMYDDGQHDDGAANDGVYGVIIPAQESGTRIRFYIEAIAGNTSRTRSYSPSGATHDVYTWLVQ